MKDRALNQDELNAIDRFGLFNLSTFLPKKPDDAHLKAMMEMFEASVNGEQYDADRWAEFYKPAGLKTEHNGNAAVDDVSAAVDRVAPIVPRAAARAVPVPAAVEDEAPFAAEPAPAAKTANKTMTPEQILAMVRNRNQNQ